MPNTIGAKELAICKEQRNQTRIATRPLGAQRSEGQVGIAIAAEIKTYKRRREELDEEKRNCGSPAEFDKITLKISKLEIQHQKNMERLKEEHTQVRDQNKDKKLGPYFNKK